MLQLPAATTDALREFCHAIAPGSDPVYLTPRPFRGAEPGLAFENLKSFVWPHWLTRRTAQPGWLLWEWPGAFLHAVHHCVARMPDGTLCDVTPAEAPWNRVFFLPDDSALEDKSNPYGRLDITKALTGDPLVTRLTAAVEKRDRFMRASLKPGLNVISDDVMQELLSVDSEAHRLRRALSRRTHPERGFVSKIPRDPKRAQNHQRSFTDRVRGCTSRVPTKTD
jgi:hypothetical protein